MAFASTWGSLVIFLLVISVGNAQLSPNFYASTCPQMLSIVRAAVNSAVSQEARMGASLLRLFFHDCFVNGCDGSVLLDDTPTFRGEKTAFPNANSLRGFEVIDRIKAQLESACPGVVSCADILAVAARDGVVALSGPSWSVPLGRRDSTTASWDDANNQLVPPSLNLNEIISRFARKGFSSNEMVALSGAHTIGLARCVTFRDRIYNDTNIDPSYAASLRGDCPRTPGTGDDNLAPIDLGTPNVFNTGYFRNVLARRSLLHSDQEIANGILTSVQVIAYSLISSPFFNDFATAMTKMSNLSPLIGSQGQIRTNCRRVN